MYYFLSMTPWFQFPVLCCITCALYNELYMFCFYRKIRIIVMAFITVINRGEPMQARAESLCCIKDELLPSWR